MKRLESANYHAHTNSAILLPKGNAGRSADPLIGCMVPVIMYPTSVVLGHFGSVAIETAQESLEPLLSGELRQTMPLATLMFHLEAEYDDEYASRIRDMSETVAQAVGILPKHISLRPYDMNSEVVIDWRTPWPRPSIFVRKSSDLIRELS